MSPDGKTLATAAKDGKTLLLWTVAARAFRRDGPPLVLSEKELAVFWADLALHDYEKVDNGWRMLGAARDNAIPFLREQILAMAVPTVDMKRIEELVADLNAEKFATREKATNDLLAAGEPTIIPLERMVEKPPSEEARASQSPTQEIGGTGFDARTPAGTGGHSAARTGADGEGDCLAGGD